MLMSEPGRIGDGGNSGFQALNLVAQFGAKSIILVGYDMRIDRGLHWYGRHRVNNPTDNNLYRWRMVLNKQAETLAGLGISVLNASPVSLLTAFPKMTLEEALDRCLS